MRFFITLFILFFSVCSVDAAPNKITLSAKLVPSEESGIDTVSNFSVVLLQQGGSADKKVLNARGNFKFKIKKNKLVGASLFVVDPQGAYYGQILVRRNNSNRTGNMFLSGKPIDQENNSIKLGKITLNRNYGVVARKVKKKVIQAARLVALSEEGAPIGSGNLGFVDTSNSGLSISNSDISEEEPGADLDGDGVPNLIDADDDGDRVMDYADSDSAETTARDNLYTTLYLGMNETLNENVGSGLSESAINNVMEAENRFAFAFFQGLRENESFQSGHFECDSALSYCDPTGSDSVYAGLSESDPTLRGQNWFDFNDDGSPYNIEFISARNVMVAGVQPRAGLNEFVAGQLMTAVINTGSEIIRKPVAIGPYFVSIPALKSYDAGFGVVEVNYSNPTEAGTSAGNRIVLSPAKTIKLTFWRPQRIGIGGAGEGEYIDMGRLNYGLLFNGFSTEFTCTEFYSDLSETLTEIPDALGEGGSPFSHNGARLWPLVDSASDAEVDPANTISFTVDLADCLDRAGESNSGGISVNLTAAGEDLSGGASRASQMIYLQLP